VSVSVEKGGFSWQLNLLFGFLFAATVQRSSCSASLGAGIALN
jgi:hypothetical protein